DHRPQLEPGKEPEESGQGHAEVVEELSAKAKVDTAIKIRWESGQMRKTLSQVSRMGMQRNMLWFLTTILFSPLTHAQSTAEVPVLKVTPEGSSINFSVKASAAIAGHFDKWDATLTFTSPDVSTGVLDIKIEAASVNTGSGMKDNKLKSKDF